MNPCRMTGFWRSTDRVSFEYNNSQLFWLPGVSPGKYLGEHLNGVATSYIRRLWDSTVEFIDRVARMLLIDYGKAIRALKTLERRRRLAARANAGFN
jgi:hypothetical protein